MTESRVTAAIEVSAIVRRVGASGDFATVLRRGDPERGTILLVISSRGRHVASLQRRLDFTSGTYRWECVGPSESTSSADIAEFLAQQTRFDPDLWQIELDIAQPERFIAETIAAG